MLNRAISKYRRGLFNTDAGFIKRWPNAPKVVFAGTPNVFADELIKR